MAEIYSIILLGSPAIQLGHSVRTEYRHLTSRQWIWSQVHIFTSLMCTRCWMLTLDAVWASYVFGGLLERCPPPQYPYAAKRSKKPFGSIIHTFNQRYAWFMPIVYGTHGLKCDFCTYVCCTIHSFVLIQSIRIDLNFWFRNHISLILNIPHIFTELY